MLHNAVAGKVSSHECLANQPEMKTKIFCILSCSFWGNQPNVPPEASKAPTPNEKSVLTSTAVDFKRTEELTASQLPKVSATFHDVTVSYTSYTHTCSTHV